MANVTAWAERVINLPEYKAVMGKVRFCAKTIPPTLTESKKVEEKKAAPVKKEGGDEEKPAKKEENPLDVLPPTTFNLYDFKTFFVN